MADARKDLTTNLAPADGPLGAEYEHDFYSWLMEQARHLREGRFEALDCGNLAEEIESLGREQFNKLVSALRVLMAHVLKWDHQTSLRSRSWILSIQEQRLEIADVLSDNPRLRPRIDEADRPRLPPRPHRGGEGNWAWTKTLPSDVSLCVRRHHHAQLFAIGPSFRIADNGSGPMRPAEKGCTPSPNHSHSSANWIPRSRFARPRNDERSAGHVRKLACAKMPSIRRAKHTEDEPRMT